MKKTAFLSSSALLLLLSSGTALAQQTLEDRVRALEQKLGVPAEMPGDNRSLEDRVKAIQAAIAIQRAISQGFEFDLRIGVHTDGALQREENYHGKGVHAAARIGAAAEGQEILASKDTLAKLDQFKTAEDREIVLKGFQHDVPVCSVEWKA